MIKVAREKQKAEKNAQQDRIREQWKNEQIPDEEAKRSFEGLG